MINLIKKYICMLCVPLFMAGLFASPGAVPAMNGAVTDTAGVLNSSQKDQIASYLTQINAQSGNQIAILTIPSLNGEAIESYSMRAAEKWKLGQKGTDNGVLVVLALKEHQARIEVGYGLEETLTDAYCGLIIRKVMIPYFQEDSYAQGLAAGVKVIAQKIGAEPSASGTAVTDSTENEDAGIPLPLFAFIVIWFMLFTMGLGPRLPFLRWLPWVAFGMRHGGSSPRHNGFYSGGHSHFGGSGGSGFSGGGFGGGGFSGGGGHFGGGGASGSW